MSTEPVSPASGGAAAIVIGTFFILTATVQAVTGAMLAGDVLASSDHLPMAARLMAPLVATVGLNALAGMLMLMRRREAIVVMGCLLGSLITSKIGFQISATSLIDLLLLALLTFFSIRLAMRGNLR